jgi:hypothetical protein
MGKWSHVRSISKTIRDFKALDHRRLCHIAHALLVIALIALMFSLQNEHWFAGPRPVKFGANQ